MAIIPTDKKVTVDPADSAPVEKEQKARRPLKDVVKLNKIGDEIVLKPALDPLKEETRKSIALLYGRMNPPTRGHEENINSLKKVAQENNADHLVVASHSFDGQRNPLTPDQKIKHLTRAFPDTNIKVADKKAPTILHQAAELHKQGYSHLIVAGGDDRAEEYNSLLNKYNDVAGRHGHYNFESITSKNTGNRVSGMSGTDMRKHVKAGDFESFKKGLPVNIAKNDQHSKELFDDVKGGLNEENEWTAAAIQRFLDAYSQTTLSEANLRDPDTYLRMASQAREQGKILRAALLTRIAAAVRRKDITTASALRSHLSSVQE